LKSRPIVHSIGGRSPQIGILLPVDASLVRTSRRAP